MLRRIEIHRHAAVQTLLNRIFQYGDPMLFFLQQPQTRPNHLAGVFVPSLCDLVLYESLEVASQRDRFEGREPDDDEPETTAPLPPLDASIPAKIHCTLIDKQSVAQR